MVPIVRSFQSYIKDTNHALEIFRGFNFSGENKRFFTIHITSLDTFTASNEGLQALKFFFHQRTIDSWETLLLLAELVLTLTCFSFADNHYKQVNGVAVGTKMGPSYANLFVGCIENQIFNQYNGTKPELFGRYIDDCVRTCTATSYSKEDLLIFYNLRQLLAPATEKAWEISENSIVFLYIKVSTNGNGLSTSVHYQPTDSHSYLLHSSSHSSHVRNSIPFSQFLRLRRLCSNDSDFPTNQKKCANASRSVAILILL